MKVTKNRTNVAREIQKRPDIISFLDSNEDLAKLFELPNELPDHRVSLYKKLYFEVGNTVYYRLSLPNNNRLFIKMEYTNAMGNTHYARFWVIYLFLAEILGVIIPGKTKLIEVTSGSSGIALSIAAEKLGYDTTILVPSLLPEKRIKPMRRENVRVIKVDGYINECILKLREMIGQESFFATNHSEEKADVIVKVFSRIGHELINDVGNIDYAVIGMGNGTSTYAIAGVLKQYSDDIQIVSYRPHYEINPDDIVFGLIGANIDCRHVPIAENYVDEMKFTSGISIDDIKHNYQFDTEISNLGYSSLYGIHFALQISQNVTNKVLVSIGYDKIDRY